MYTNTFVKKVYTHIVLVLFLNEIFHKTAKIFFSLYSCQDWEAWKAELLKEDFDPALFEASDLKQIRRCMQIGLLCADLRGRRRPNMDQVLEMLNGNKKLPNIKKPAWSDEWRRWRGFNIWHLCLP